MRVRRTFSATAELSVGAFQSCHIIGLQVPVHGDVLLSERFVQPVVGATRPAGMSVQGADAFVVLSPNSFPCSCSDRAQYAESWTA